MGFGASAYGSSPFGDGVFNGLFNAVSASAPTAYYVDLVFDAVLDFSGPLTLFPSTYALDNGLIPLAVAEGATPNVVRIYTTQQSLGVLYTITVDLALVGLNGEVLNDNTAAFLGVSSLLVYEVADLASNTHCAGRRVDLAWINPAGVVWTKIARRQKNWIFDLTDPHDVVYDGVAIDSFADSGVLFPSTTLTANASAGDTIVSVASSAGFVAGNLVRVEQLEGPLLFEIATVVSAGVGTLMLSPLVNAYSVSLSNRISKSSTQQLEEQTYYYYTVLVSDVPSPPDIQYTFSDANRVAGLSIAVMDSKETFFWNNTPEYMRERDAQQLGTGGGGFLDQWYDIMGCWLNLMRGTMAAALQAGNDDAAPYNTLSAKNYSLGIDPEGYSYDFEIPRRSVVSLVNVYKRRGTCEGIIRAVSMFTKWDAACAEFALGGCGSGPKSFSTWDGTSPMDQNTAAAIAVVNRSVTDTSKAWMVDEWRDGIVIGAIGDVACVESNTSTQLSLQEPSRTHSVDGTVLMGAVVIPLSGTAGIIPGICLQLESAAMSSVAEIVEVLSIVPGVSITVTEPVLNTYMAGDYVSIGKSLLRKEFRGSGGTWTTVSGNIRELTYPNGQWTQTQWVQYKILASDNTLHDVVSNEGNTLRISAVSLPANGVFAIARNFTLGGNFAARTPWARYRVYGGTHSFLFEPTLDLELVGTVYDPFSRLWMGPGSTILGAWSDGDVGVYILTPVTQHLGKASTAATDTLDLDPTQPAPAVNEWVGYYLNPNQNQTQLFLIVSNTATTVTVVTSMSSLVVAGQVYYVLKPRDANRYRQLVKRLGPPSREFAHLDITVRVLFA